MSKDVENVQILGEKVQNSVNDIKAVTTRFHHDLNRMAFKLRRAERILYRVYRPAQTLVGHNWSIEPVAWTSSPFASSLAHSPLKRKRAEQSSIAHGQPPMKRLCGPSVLLLPQAGSSTASSQLTREHVEGLSNGTSTATESTYLYEIQSSTKDDKDIDHTMTDSIALVEVTSELPDICFSTASLTSSIGNYIQEEGHTYHSYGLRRYMLPNDESWIELEDLLHHLLHRIVLNGKPLLCLTGDIDGRVLDVGTGTGLWAMEGKP
ncbi:hypothetical protein IL306_014757 [Fusarium sp. DS 682]|nr:hypothetical protein IL306_014757 [Fusarium sp. DS 682]